ncbi:S8 family serine peptidase [Hazenella sp. IB182357]|uniref:S8 family serine peptidase n=1 Tax=Polycladospora coralii TaxID=2771432 RepID=A0A926RUY6_9BACL|nr:S8 family serine peptidase [Polycladospora coralii]MBD1373172.1 S8 family serine peptidase [Polycladospora coralii]
MLKQWRFHLALLLATVLTFSGFSLVGASPSKEAKPTDSKYYFVQMDEKPVASYDGGIKGFQSTKAAANEKLDVKSSKVQSYRQHLRSKRANLKNWMGQKVKGAKIEAEYELAFNGVAIKATPNEAKALQRAPGVKQVVESKQYRPLMNRSHSIINDKPLWKKGYNGEGVKVAIIDSGIDQNHPYLTDNSLPIPAGFPKSQNDEWLKYTSNKVIVAKVYSGEQDVSPEAIGSHGTHVAGTVAGIKNYKDPSGLAESKLSGVAPKAYLGNYNVFPCEDCSAESIHIAQAIEDAVNDGMDVANLSLGGPASTGFDLLVEVVNAASDAGMTMVISAGNSGPGPQTIGSPGIAENAITVGAVSNAHFFGKSIAITVDGEERILPVGSADPGAKVDEAFSADLAIVTENDGLGCEAISQDLTGKIAVLKRGTCAFTQKGMNAQAKGALGVILINNSPGDPSSMSVEESVSIPMVMLKDEDGAWILGGNNRSASFEPGSDREFTTPNHSLIANFSSRGPTINGTLKPDVAAVGVNVYSSIVGGGLSSYNGTSMSAPHVAGAAALLLQSHPDWTPQDVKSSLMATAKNPKSDPNPLEVGAGIINVGRADAPYALANPASLSFGTLKTDDRGTFKTIKVTLKNPTNKKITYKLSTDNKTLKLSKTKFKVKKGETKTFEVTAYGRFNEPGGYAGYITATPDGKRKNNMRIPYYFGVE